VLERDVRVLHDRPTRTVDCRLQSRQRQRNRLLPLPGLAVCHLVDRDAAAVGAETASRPSEGSRSIPRPPPRPNMPVGWRRRSPDFAAATVSFRPRLLMKAEGSRNADLASSTESCHRDSPRPAPGAPLPAVARPRRLAAGSTPRHAGLLLHRHQTPLNRPRRHGAARRLAGWAKQLAFDSEARDRDQHRRREPRSCGERDPRPPRPQRDCSTRAGAHPPSPRTASPSPRRSSSPTRTRTWARGSSARSRARPRRRR